MDVAHLNAHESMEVQIFQTSSGRWLEDWEINDLLLWDGDRHLGLGVPNFIEVPRPRAHMKTTFVSDAHGGARSMKIYCS